LKLQRLFPNFSPTRIAKDAVVHTWGEAITCLGRLRGEMPGCPILIQEFLTGAEYSIRIIGNPGQGYRVLPPLGADYSRLDPALPRLLPYESKWIPNSPYWSQINYREAVSMKRRGARWSIIRTSSSSGLAA